jgi:hypothetical protein
MLPQHYTASQPRRPRLETSPWKPQNSHRYTYPCAQLSNTAWRSYSLLNWAPHHVDILGEWSSLKRWYPTTTLHRVTTQKISTWIFTAVKVLNLANGKLLKTLCHLMRFSVMLMFMLIYAEWWTSKLSGRRTWRFYIANIRSRHWAWSLPLLSPSQHLPKIHLMSVSHFRHGFPNCPFLRDFAISYVSSSL